MNRATPITTTTATTTTTAIATTDPSSSNDYHEPINMMKQINIGYYSEHGPNHSVLATFITPMRLRDLFYTHYVRSYLPIEEHKTACVLVAHTNYETDSSAEMRNKGTLIKRFSLILFSFRNDGTRRPLLHYVPWEDPQDPMACTFLLQRFLDMSKKMFSMENAAFVRGTLSLTSSANECYSFCCAYLKQLHLTQNFVEKEVARIQGQVALNPYPPIGNLLNKPIKKPSVRKPPRVYADSRPHSRIVTTAAASTARPSSVHAVRSGPTVPMMKAKQIPRRITIGEYGAITKQMLGLDPLERRPSQLVRQSLLPSSQRLTSSRSVPSSLRSLSSSSSSSSSSRLPLRRKNYDTDSQDYDDMAQLPTLVELPVPSELPLSPSFVPNTPTRKLPDRDNYEQPYHSPFKTSDSDVDDEWELYEQ